MAEMQSKRLKARQGNNMPPSFKLSAEERQLIRDIVAGLEGDERHREASRVRSIVCRMNPDYRAADNAKKAARERAKYHADIEESRRKGAEKARRKVALRTLTPPTQRTQLSPPNAAGCREKS
jgi:hypothetical protein